jgi:PAS domain S-box-containing protein
MNGYWAGIRARLTTKRAQSFSRRDLALCGFLTALYVATEKWGLVLYLWQRHETALWLPAGIGMAAFLLLGYRVWPAIFAGSFIIHALSMSNVLAAAGVSVSNILEGAIGCYLVRRFARGTGAFDTAEGVFKFTFYAGFVGPAVGATAGSIVFYLAGLTTSNHSGHNWLTWCLADGIGILVIAPFLILLFGRSHHPLGPRELLELTVLILALLFTCILVFGPLSTTLNGSHFIGASLCIPFLIWAGFRFCQLEAAGVTLILFGSAIWGTSHQVGYFVTPDLTFSLQKLDMFIGIVGPMALAVAAVVAERKEIETNLLGTQSLLQEAVAGKGRDLATMVEALREKEAEREEGDQAPRRVDEKFRLRAERIPVVFWLLDAVEERLLCVSPTYETIWGRSCESLYADPHSWLDAVHPEDHELAAIFFDRGTKRDRLEAEYRIIRPDGSVRWIWDRCFVIRDESDRISRLAGLASDVTERKRLGQSFLTTQAQKPENG